MKSATRVLVTGAGGFIGHHLVKRLKAEGYWVRGVDIKEPEFEPTAADEFELLDLRFWHNTLQATSHMTRSSTWPPTWVASATSPQSWPILLATTS